MKPYRPRRNPDNATVIISGLLQSQSRFPDLGTHKLSVFKGLRASPETGEKNPKSKPGVGYLSLPIGPIVVPFREYLIEF